MRPMSSDRSQSKKRQRGDSEGGNFCGAERLLAGECCTYRAPDGQNPCGSAAGTTRANPG